MKHWSLAIGCFSVFAVASSGCGASPGAPTATPAGAAAVTAAASSQSPGAEHPPFNLEAILRGDGFGHVKFRQEKDSTHNVINLDVWVRDLLAHTSYSLQRATDTTLDGVCTGANWLSLGEGPTAHPIVTDDTGSARAALWRDLSALTPGTTFDIHFRVIENGTSPVHVPLQSDCERFIVRN